MAGLSSFSTARMPSCAFSNALLAASRVVLTASLATFRDSHEVVALAVREADGRGVDLSDLSIAELQKFSDLIADDVHEVLIPEGSLKARNHLGGTAPEQVLLQVARWRELINA